VAALHQSAPVQMTWLEDPPPWLRPVYCFAFALLRFGNSVNRKYLTAERFICFILKVKQSQRRWRTTNKRSSTFLEKKCHPGDLARRCSDLEMTRLICCSGANDCFYRIRVTDENKRRSRGITLLRHPTM